MCVQCGVCALCVVVSGVLCVSVGVCVLVCVCVCVVMCGVGAGAGVQCVVSVVFVRGVCVVCVVCGSAWHVENPCVRSKRLRMYRQNARMLNTCALFAGKDRGLLNLHTGTC